MANLAKENQDQRQPQQQPKKDWFAQLFPLRILGEYDEKHELYVAYCLETGNVATADDMETVLDMMKELLEDEISRVIASRNIRNLFSTPAPLEIRERWTELANAGNDIGQIELTIRVPAGSADARNTETTIAVLKALRPSLD